MPITRFRGFAWSPSGSRVGLVSRADAFEVHWAAKPTVLQDGNVPANKRDKLGAQRQKVTAMIPLKIIPFLCAGFESQLP